MKGQSAFLEHFRPPEGESLRAAVLTTHDFNRGYFESTVLPTMLGINESAPDEELQGGVDRASPFFLALRARLLSVPLIVIADARANDHEVASRYENYELLYSRAFRKFHPKVYLLVFDRTFRLVVASANLTRRGFHENLEVCWARSTEVDDKFGHTAGHAIAFLRKLAKMEWPTCRAITIALDAIAAKAPSNNSGPPLLSSVSESILGQWQRGLPDRRRIEELHIVSPFFDGDGDLAPWDSIRSKKTLIYVRRELVGEKPRCLMQISKRAFRRASVEPVLISPEWLGTSEADQWKKPTPRYPHAKVIAVKSGNRGWAVVGSANFTAPALLGRGQSRNVEAVIALNGSWSEIRKLLPPIYGPAPKEEWEFRPSGVQSENADVRLPFVTLAEYDPERRKLNLEFNKGAKPAGVWSVKYQHKVIAKGGAAAFVKRLKMNFKLQQETCLVLTEGKHRWSVPIVVVSKELLPMLPELDDLPYESILDYLAAGVENLASFRVRSLRRKMRASDIEVDIDHVAFMEDLIRLTKAYEKLRARMAAPLTTLGEAKALFFGGFGTKRLIDGFRKDRKIDRTYRSFALIELGALLSSIRFRGDRRVVRYANKTARQQSKWAYVAAAISPKIAKEYKKSGADSWVRHE